MLKENVSALSQRGTFTDFLTEVLRSGAQALLAKAVEAEAADFLDRYAALKTADGRQRLVRHGHLPEHAVTGIGAVPVRQPRVRDWEPNVGKPGIKFSPSIPPAYARRSKSLDVLLPILYLKGVSTGDFGEALAALLGKDAPGLSASTIAKAQEGLGGRTQGLEKARSFNETLRLYLGRWHPFAGPS